jgi:N-acetylmuramoyl-L-alanine amidase
LIILDPGHGGSDPGARGPTGAVEKEAALMITRIIRIELERQGFRVVMTRNDDTNPSYDDRAALANAHHDAIFISIHVSTTGTIGTAHAYYYQFASPVAAAAGSSTIPAPTPQPGGLALWEQAQRPYLEASRHFADILEAELAQRLPGSPATSSPAAVRELRSVALPAVAVELSSVAVSDSRTLISLAPPLATSIVRSIESSRATNSAGAN